MKLVAADTLAELIAQHDSLRGIMGLCQELADLLDDHPDGDPTPLTRELARLRLAFDAHNTFEEQLLRPVLLDMVDDHIHEHRSIGERLGSPATMAVRDVIETLRAHLDAEDRYLDRAGAARPDGAAQRLRR